MLTGKGLFELSAARGARRQVAVGVTPNNLYRSRNNAPILSGMKYLSDIKLLLCVSVLLGAPFAMHAQDAETLIAAAPAIAPTPAPFHTEHLTALRWIRRATLGASCIAGTVVNNWALHQVASQPNVVLSGPFVSNGKPKYGLVMAIGVGTCAFSGVIQETPLFGRETHRSDVINIIENLGGTGYSAWLTYHYLELRDQAHTALMAQPAIRP